METKFCYQKTIFIVVREMEYELEHDSDDLKYLGRARGNEDHVAFFYGKISGATASLVTYFMTANFTFLMLSVAMLFFMYGDARSFAARKVLLKNKDADWTDWDRQYNLLSTGFMALMGIWCFFCFTLTNDLFIHLLCVATAMGNILSLICRNFADDRVLTFQLAAVGVPLIAGILTYGDLRAMILCGFFMPLFSSVKDISKRLSILFTGIQRQSEEKERFGIQLNEALESMSHGLIMFDDEMKLRIINKTAREILKMDPNLNCYSKKLTEIARFVDMKRPHINRVRLLEDALMKRLKHRTAEKVFEIEDNRFVELSIMLREMGGCVLVIEDVTERIQYQTRINQLAKYDELTGLFNRSYFLQQAKSTMSRMKDNNRGALVFFDLDDFKRINDTLGHEAGDFILSTVAQRLKTMLPETSLVARYGGDEYVLFLDSDLGEEKLKLLCQKILDTITEEITYNNQVLRYGASLGVAQFPQDGKTVDRLLKLADLALYDAKNNGKNAFRFFSAEMEDTLHQRLVMEEDLTKAVEEGDLTLHFQPIIALEDGRPRVFEALTRWVRNGENVSPAEFIPIAEDLGLIREIGEWTLIEACRQCQTWPEETSVAVNMSAVQFQVGSVTQAVRHALDATGLDPSRLEVEITETAVLNDMSHAIVVLEKLSDLGVRISLDDFGTGYSSLSYLHKLPLDKLKIDKSFIDDIANSQRSRTLLKGISALGKALELKVVVEGVETQDQLTLLRQEYDIDYVQGYFFSKALPEEEARKYVLAHKEPGTNEKLPELLRGPQLHVA